ncbi:hypothetical protein [uncultured Duncaniella sp.]|uniref:hypothetical protein n=1 Tax=uncultured Duncaniella sp. TaxID=2768039 RepID=UPI0034A0FF74
MSSRLVKSWKEWDAGNPAVRSLWTTSTETSVWSRTSGTTRQDRHEKSGNSYGG